MDRQEAERDFIRADLLYRENAFEECLAVLEDLNGHFPNQHRILFPIARCLAKLGRYQEALETCGALVEDHEYEKARPLFEKLAEFQAEPSSVELTPYLEMPPIPEPTKGSPFDSKVDLKNPTGRPRRRQPETDTRHDTPIKSMLRRALGKK